MEAESLIVRVQAQPGESLGHFLGRLARAGVIATNNCKEQSQMIRQFAGEEDSVRWSAAIAQWMQNYSPMQPVHPLKLWVGLDIAFVELWRGLLLGTEFEVEQTGDFYNSEIWIKHESGGDLN